MNTMASSWSNIFRYRPTWVLLWSRFSMQGIRTFHHQGRPSSFGVLNQSLVKYKNYNLLFFKTQRCQFNNNSNYSSFYKNIGRQREQWYAKSKGWRSGCCRPRNCLYKYRSFHTSTRRDAWPVAALLVKFVGPLSKVFKLVAMVGGRTFRKWYQKLSPQYKKQLLNDRRTEKLVIVSGGVGGLFIAYYFFHLEETPVTNRVRFMPIGNAQMEHLVESEYKQTLELCGEYILPVNHPDHIRVFQVTKRLLRSNQSKETDGIKWQVNVVNTPDVNAFVLPNGQIFMFKGMLNVLSNDSELATILGHEMAHAILGHGAEQASLHGIINLFIVVSLAILWAVLPTDYIAIAAQWIQDQILNILLHLPYSRKLEEEADEVGMLFAAKACFDVRQSPKVWERLAAQQQLEGNPDVEWLSTHPSHATRANNLESLLPEALEIRKECNCPALESLPPFLVTRQPRLMKLFGLNIAHK